MSDEIRICMGSSCFSRGNKRNLEIIEEFLRARGKERQIRLRGSRCEGHCPKGPNIVINGERHGDVDEGALFDLLEKHFGADKES